MRELKTLYWTHGHVKRGIISLAKDGIVVYHTEAKLDLTDENLRDVIYTNVNFKNIIDIGIEFTFLRGKVLFLILEEKVFENTEKHGFSDDLELFELTTMDEIFVVPIKQIKYISCDSKIFKNK